MAVLSRTGTWTGREGATTGGSSSVFLCSFLPPPRLPRGCPKSPETPAPPGATARLKSQLRASYGRVAELGLACSPGPCEDELGPKSSVLSRSGADSPLCLPGARAGWRPARRAPVPRGSEPGLWSEGSRGGHFFSSCVFPSRAANREPLCHSVFSVQFSKR